jgi:hypothetical protein
MTLGKWASKAWTAAGNALSGMLIKGYKYSLSMSDISFYRGAFVRFSSIYRREKDLSISFCHLRRQVEEIDINLPKQRHILQ